MIFYKNNRALQCLSVHNFLLVLCVVGTLIIIGWLFSYSSYGIDFTDESFYLVWISNPFIYDASVTQFGFIYYPICWLLGGDIVALRQANILITFCLAWALCYTFLTSLAPELKEKPGTLFAAAAGLATSSFILIDYRMFTPSYNSLALQALLVSAIGLVLAERTTRRASSAGWVLIGVGGWLAFMAKPSTALALAVGVFTYLLLSRKLSIRMLALTVASAIALLLVSALLIDGSVLLFLERLRLGVEFAKYLGGGHELTRIIRIDDFYLHELFVREIVLNFIFLFFALVCLRVGNGFFSIIGSLVSFCFFLLTVMSVFEISEITVNYGVFKGFLIFGVIYAAVTAALVFGRFKEILTIFGARWAIILLFLLMPHFYAFGTNGNYWQSGGSAAIFWLLAGLALLGPLFREYSSWLLILPLVLATQAVTSTLLQVGFDQPYRQPQPLRLNSSLIDIGPQKSELVLSEGYSKYISSAMAAAREAEFEPNTPMIDLSGQSSGILYALGAESIGQAWTIGGYPGSLMLARAAFGRTSCGKIANAWILFEPEGPRSIPAELMTSLGANFPEGYEHVGTWHTAEGAGGYAERRIQQLYKPVEPQETMMNCQILRTKVTQ